MPTIPVNVVQLKSRLSAYLRRVKAGREFVITERGDPVAKLVPVAKTGIVRAGRGRLPAILRTPPEGISAGVLDAWLAERGDTHAGR